MRFGKILLFLIFALDSNYLFAIDKELKIGIVGAHGVGKTTIVNKVRKKLKNKNIIFINEIFRDVYKESVKEKFKNQKKENLTIASYAKQLYIENLEKYNKKNILTDRSVYDVFIYNVDKSNTRHYEALKKHAKEYLKTYDKIYLIVPSERGIEDDGFRFDLTKEGQLEIHNKFMKVFAKLKNVILVDQEDQDKIVQLIIKDFN